MASGESTRRFHRSFLAIAVASAVPSFTLAAGQFTVTKTADSVVDSRGMTLVSGAPYGRGVNGESFQTDTITTFGGYQFTSYWVNNAGSYYVAVARRAFGSTTWDHLDLPASNWLNGGIPPSDAHNVVSLGIDPTDGTLHLAYDMHGNTLRYRVSDAGAATAASWNASLFSTGERNWLVNSSSPLSTVTYPMFFRTPGGDMQLAYRIGASGGGSWMMYDYDGSTHAWSNGHQIDDGFVGTYTGTSSNGSANRNNYPNGFTYGSDGKLYSTFTWRENATGVANHDLSFVFSDDGGNTWKNNAGQIIGSKTLNTRFNLTSPGLVVRPLAESQSLMNQNSQAVDSENHVHALVWHRDSSKTASPDGTWDPQESSYFQYWRDNLGNWHQDRLPGNVGQRPQIYFDANDNAIAVYQVAAGGAALSSGNLYVANGDLVIAAATKANNWTDWKIIRTETGPFVSEAHADGELLKSTGSLSVIMQTSPTDTTAQATSIRTLDYSISLAPASVATLSVSGNWNTAANWSGSSVPGLNTAAIISNGNSANINSAAGAMDSNVVVGAGGSNGSLTIATGATLNPTQAGLFGTTYGGSIIVGRDGGSVGSYNQTGGTVTASRFVVGDYFNETSGGGASTAIVSGGTLNIGELNVAFSPNGSSSGSSFNISGGAVTVNGEIVLGEFGNAATLNLSGGRLTVAGDVREGFNGVNNATLKITSGGTLDMTSNTVTVDNFIYNGGLISNLRTGSAGGMAGINAGTVQIAPNAPGATTLTMASNTRLNVSNRLELWPTGSVALGTGAAASVGTTQSYTSNQVNITAGGTLAGDGRINQTVNNNGGVVAPGHADVSTGALKLGANFTQNAAGAIEIDLGGTTPGSGYDQLQITGAVTLNGVLRIGRFGSYMPLPGTSYDVITFGSSTGDVTVVNQTGLAGLLFTKAPSATKLTIQLSAQYGGDANLDGTVDVTDLGALATNWQTNSNWLGGDFSGDGFVDVTDLGILATNWQKGGPPLPRARSFDQAMAEVGLGAASVPEPAMFGGVAMICGLSTLRRRR